MSLFALIVLAVVFFATALISVVTGGTSLITVPVMIQMGIDARVAVATNMFALIFLSLGGTIPFVNGPFLNEKRLPVLIGLTLLGSIVGALLLFVIPSKSMPLVIAVAMIAVALFSFSQSEAGVVGGRRSEAIGYLATLVLGIYGGFFSGGYVVLLTAACVAFFGMTFREAVAITKLLNFFSSLVAVIIFAYRNVIDWRLGLLLSVASFAGGIVGALFAQRMSDVWLRRIFLAAVFVLAAKTIFYDLAMPAFVTDPK